MNAAFFHDTVLKYDGKEKYYTKGGMNEKVMKQYLKYFTTIEMVTRVDNIKENEDISKMGLNTCENVKYNSIKKLDFVSLLFGKDRKKIRETIQRTDCAIIRMPSFIGIVACIEAHKQKKKYMIEMVTCPLDSLSNHGGIVYKVLAPIISLINKKLVKRAKYVRYVTEEFLQNRYPTNGMEFSCSDVRINKMDESVLEKRINKIINDNNTYKLGLIGSLDVNFKGHDVLIKAVSLIKQYNVEVHFLGLGNKERWQQLINEYNVHEKIFFDGTLPSGEKVWNWLDELDIFVMPSLQEGLPRSLVEAMSRACPCIGTPTGGIPELVGKDLIIKKKDYIMLSEKIIELLSDKEKMKKIATENFEKAKKFQPEVLESKESEFYKIFIGENND